MINNIIAEKRINLGYLIWGKEVVVISTFINIVQYQIREPVKVLLIMNKKRQLLKGTFMGMELNVSIERKVMIAPLIDKGNIAKMNKLADVTGMVLSLDELDNTDNLEGKRLSNALLTYHVTDSEDFMCLEPVTV